MRFNLFKSPSMPDQSIDNMRSGNITKHEVEFDFSWVDYPIFDQDGYPIQDRGISEIPGLYFLGLHFLHKRRSGLLWGVGEDADFIANAISASA